MPTPAKTTNKGIVDAARILIERDGSDFSVASLAELIGIRAPSLYKRFENRAAIMEAVEAQVTAELGEVIARSLTRRGARKSDAPLASAARAYRMFAKANPRSYALLFAAGTTERNEIQTARVAALAPVLDYFAKTKPETDALSAARFLTTLLHGFVSMELAGAFHMGGSVDDAFEDAIGAMLQGLGV